MTSVSVITPFLNPGDYLAQAIESVRSQTFGEWELLLVDDGSTDDSPGIARRYAERDARIRILGAGEHGRGAAAARNYGIERATGQRPHLPARVGDLFDREERYAELPGDYDAVAAYVAEHATPAN